MITHHLTQIPIWLKSHHYLVPIYWYVAAIVYEVYVLKERPFNILIPNVAEKNILILVEGKKSDSEFLSYNLMLNSGKKKNSNSRVVRKKNSERKKKP